MHRLLLLIALLLCCVHVPAQPGSPEDGRREAATGEFTRRMKEANYPALFDKAAEEFKVPSDVLKGIAFAETRWEHLAWPPGETVSPDTGMPRPYGIMSLWDNPFFGHSLLEAAQLLGEDPELLKKDALQNMRGAAALLRKIYDETAKPDGTTENDVESWRYAIRKYCGIPEPELNARHALDIYTFMSQGYHQYGIEWNARPVNLEPIRQETMRIVAEAQSKQQRSGSPAGNEPTPAANPPEGEPARQSQAAMSNSLQSSGSLTNRERKAIGYPAKRAAWWLIGGGPMIVLIALLLAIKGKSTRE